MGKHKINTEYFCDWPLGKPRHSLEDDTKIELMI
jgi:hypothetical protein